MCKVDSLYLAMYLLKFNSILIIHPTEKHWGNQHIVELNLVGTLYSRAKLGWITFLFSLKLCSHGKKAIEK